MSDTPIRVLHLCVTSGVSGRTERQLLQQCHEFVRTEAAPEMRVSVAFVRRRRQPSDDLARMAAALGLDYHSLTRLGRLDATLLWRLRRLIRRLQVDVVHAHDAASNLLALLVQPLCGFRTVTTAGEQASESSPPSGINQKLLPGFHRIIAANKQLALQLCQLGCRPNQVDVIRAGVDTEQFSRTAVGQSLRQQLGLAPDARVVGANYRLCRGDALTRLATAVRLAEFAVGPIHLLLFADEAAESDEPDWDAFDGPQNRVHNLGVVPDGLPSAYEAMNLYYAPGQGPDVIRSLLEAQSMELPVIGHRLGNVPEVVAGGTTGLLLGTADGDALVDAITSLLVDRPRAQALATAARLRVCQQFRATDHLRMLAQTYRRAFREA